MDKRVLRSGSALFGKPRHPRTTFSLEIEGFIPLFFGKVGFRQVNFLTDYVRKKTLKHIQKNNNNLQLIPHERAFGSGGDLIKTIHATTRASIIVSPLIRICKTGTGNITSLHGRYQAIILCPDKH